jgi:hypothetical protein
VAVADVADELQRDFTLCRGPRSRPLDGFALVPGVIAHHAVELIALDADGGCGFAHGRVVRGGVCEGFD